MFMPYFLNINLIHKKRKEFNKGKKCNLHKQKSLSKKI